MNTNNTDLDQSDLDLDYVRVKRKEVIESLTKKGTPEDIKEVQTLLMALSDMDRAALSKKKIKVDKDIGANHNQAMELIAKIFTDPSVKKMGVSDIVANRLLPELGSDVSTPDLIDGETGDNLGSENYDTFMSRVS